MRERSVKIFRVFVFALIKVLAAPSVRTFLLVSVQRTINQSIQQTKNVASLISIATHLDQNLYKGVTGAG